MVDFILVNKNPKGRKTGDCSTRALCNILKISYDKALEEQFEMAKKHCFGITTKETINKIMIKYGWEMQKQPKTIYNKKFMVRDIDKVLSDEEMENGALVYINKHFTVVRNYFIEDTWNCGVYKINNYWVKKYE